MDYNPIKNFLNKFKEVLTQNDEKRMIIKKVITKHISYPITNEMIKIKGLAIKINGSPALHNEILIHKHNILKDLSNLLPQPHFIDIY